MQTVERLYNQFQPNNYQISLTIDRVNRIFTGDVVITGKSVNSNKITLHSKGLSIISASIDGNIASFDHGKNDALNLYIDDLSEGAHKIDIKFSGNITNHMHGMYPCFYEHEGIKKEIIATQFESHHAREVFPCIDEPEAKATFDVTLKTENEVTVLGNMPVKTQVDHDNELITTFETTPVMSSYLLAWVVGELHKKSAKTKNGVEVNIWATPAQPVDSLDFALDIAIKSTEFFEEYFDTPYPLPKCDHVALPDFGSGAMENWGLITYREVALLANPKTTSISSKHYVATVIAHELSHQWFGNLVTMKWWDDLWLNESFATLVEYIAVDAIEPEWNIWLDFAGYESIASLRRDSIDGVQPVKTEVNHPDEIGTLFDGAIVYAKGARLMKMLWRYIGEDAFRSGLKNYFKQYAYKNTVGSDLWQCLSDTSNKDVGAFMNSWIEQPGFPVLNASYQNGQIKLSQKRMSSKLDTKQDEQIWPITLNSNYTDLPKLFKTKELLVKTEVTDTIRFNIGNDAHFITNYSSELMSKIIEQLKRGELKPIDRLQLIIEQSLLARAGIISTADLIPLISVFDNESTEAVWDAISLAIADIKRIIEDDEQAENKFRSLVGSLVNKKYIELGWSPKECEDETTTKLRSTIIALALYSEDSEVIQKAKDIFKTNHIEGIDPELRSIVLSTVVKFNDDTSLIDNLIGTYKTTNSGDIKNDICSGLTSTKDEKTIKRLIEILKDTSNIKIQDTFRWVAYLMRNKYSREIMWDWVRSNWDWIENTFGGDKSYDDYPRYTAAALLTRKQLKEYKDFFEPKISNPALTRVIKMGINEISDRVDLIERDKQAVKNYLLNN